MYLFHRPNTFKRLEVNCSVAACSEACIVVAHRYRVANNTSVRGGTTRDMTCSATSFLTTPLNRWGKYRQLCWRLFYRNISETLLVRMKKMVTLQLWRNRTTEIHLKPVLILWMICFRVVAKLYSGLFFLFLTQHRPIRIVMCFL